jgi:hypothetical protein
MTLAWSVSWQQGIRIARSRRASPYRRARQRGQSLVMNASWRMLDARQVITRDVLRTAMEPIGTHRNPSEPIVHSRGPDSVRCGYGLPVSLSDDAGTGGRIGGHVIVCYWDALGPQIALDAKQQHVVG